MKKTLFLGNKKLAEFNLSSNRDVKVGEDDKTGNIKIVFGKRKEVTAHEQQR